VQVLEHLRVCPSRARICLLSQPRCVIDASLIILFTMYRRFIISDSSQLSKTSSYLLGVLAGQGSLDLQTFHLLEFALSRSALPLHVTKVPRSTFHAISSALRALFATEVFCGGLPSWKP